jgi:hypothetical protein
VNRGVTWRDCCGAGWWPLWWWRWWLHNAACHTYITLLLLLVAATPSLTTSRIRKPGDRVGGLGPGWRFNTIQYIHHICITYRQREQGDQHPVGCPAHFTPSPPPGEKCLETQGCAMPNLLHVTMLRCGWTAGMNLDLSDAVLCWHLHVGSLGTIRIDSILVVLLVKIADQ